MSKHEIAITHHDETAVLAEQLTTQYQRAIGGLMEVVKFGAMMLSLRERISAKGTGNAANFAAKGNGLAGWIEENCPHINRCTAYRFMNIAEGVRDELAIGTKVDFAGLLATPTEDLEPKLAKKRLAVEDFLAGKSQRQLVFQFAKPDPARRGGARVAGPDTRTPEEKLEEEKELIRQNHAKHLQSFEVYTDYGEWRRLARIDQEAYLGFLEGLAVKVRHHLKLSHKG